MQETELFPPLLQDNKHCVQEVQDLGNIKDVQDKCDRWVLLVKVIAWDQSITSAVSSNTGLDAHVRTQHDLDHVVGKLEGIQSLDSGQKWHDNL